MIPQNIHRQPDSFTVGLVQMRCGTDPDANLEHAVTKVREAASRGAQVVCLPELFRSQYFCQKEDPSLFDPPFDQRQLDAIAAGEVPEHM